jgi:deoxyribose-phosphate aldolase
MSRTEHSDPHRPDDEPSRNPGMALDPGWIDASVVDRDELRSRVVRIENRTPDPPGRSAELCLQAIACMDLTTLSGDDTAERVRQLCSRARSPISEDLAVRLEVDPDDCRAASVCIYPRFIEDARKGLEGSGIPVCTVSAGFPHGLSRLRQRVDEVRAAADAGAAEIDVVIMRAHVLTGNWSALYDEISAFREACREAHLKTILSTGELGTPDNVLRASLVAMMAGSDFIKTSTGKEKVNATLQVGLVMADAIRQYGARTGIPVGLKPAGGIRTADQAMDWLYLAGEELGPEWTRPELFRFGASSLLDDLEQRLRILAGN